MILSDILLIGILVAGVYLWKKIAHRESHQKSTPETVTEIIAEVTMTQIRKFLTNR